MCEKVSVRRWPHVFDNFSGFLAAVGAKKSAFEADHAIFWAFFGFLAAVCAKKSPFEADHAIFDILGLLAAVGAKNFDANKAIFDIFGVLAAIGAKSSAFDADHAIFWHFWGF